MNERRIRKSVADLTLADFAEFPAWEFALDEEGEEGQDETTVRPWTQDGPVDPTAGMFVRARFVLADGTAMSGYLTPPVQDDDSLGTLQPIIITDDGQVMFWCGVISPSADEIERSYRRLGKSSASQVFPIAFHSDIALVGGEVKGELPGFLILEDFRTGRTRTVG